MLGFKKKKIEMKSVEDYVNGDDAPTLNIEDIRKEEVAGRKGAGNAKHLIAPFIGVLVVLILIIAAFAKINTLSSEVAGLRTQLHDAGVQDLKSQVAALDAKLQRAGKESAQLKDDIARLEKELEAAKAQQAKMQAVAKKPVSTEKKKPVNKDFLTRGSIDPLVIHQRIGRRRRGRRSRRGLPRWKIASLFDPNPLQKSRLPW